MQKRIDLKVFGFYIGDLDVPVAQVDIPIRTAKFLTVTPSYMYYSAPPSALNELAPQPLGFTDSYAEHQFRVDGTVPFTVRKFEISARNMYVRRFRPAPADDGTAIAECDRASYEPGLAVAGGWNRYRIWSGVTLPLNRQLLLQPSYMWESTERSRNIHYVLVGLIVNTR